MKLEGLVVETEQKKDIVKDGYYPTILYTNQGWLLSNYIIYKSINQSNAITL
jgi:hypothetical protein